MPANSRWDLIRCLKGETTENEWLWTVGRIMFGVGKEEGVWSVILQMVEPVWNPAPRDVTAIMALHISCRTRAFPCTTSRCVAQTSARSGRPPSSLQSVIERSISALLRSLQQLSWRRAPYKGCPRKRETPSAGTRAKIIHVGLERQKKPQLIYCHFQ